MTTDYSASLDKITNVSERLMNLSQQINKIRSEDRSKYPNAQLRSWSGNVIELEKFATGLEDWTRQPEAAESRRLLAEIAEWAGSGRQHLLEQISSDSKFLSDNTESIKDIHENIDDISFECFKKPVSSYCLSRIVEKDIMRAKSWSTNAKIFSARVEQIEVKTFTSTLAKQVQKDAMRDLKRVDNFADAQESLIDSYSGYFFKADTLSNIMPPGISDRILIDAYKKGQDIASALDQVNDKLTNTRNLLVDIEWIVKLQNTDEYEPLWTTKQTALKGKSLEQIEKTLIELRRTANDWKAIQKQKLEGIISKVRRMSDSLELKNFHQQIQQVEAGIGIIDWNKPDVELFSSWLDEAKKILDTMRQELLGKLLSKDATMIVENPEIIADMGRNIDWTFDRFIKALKIVLREGLIEIQAAEGK